MPEINGKEVLDPTPVAVPAGMGRPESLQETIRRLVRNEVSQVAQKYEMETFEEASDFDVDDEDDYLSPYELTEMQEEQPYVDTETDQKRPEQSDNRAKRDAHEVSQRKKAKPVDDGDERAEGENPQSGQGDLQE